MTSLPQNNVWNIAPNSYLPNPQIAVSLVCVPVITSALSSPSCAGQSNGTIQVIVSGGIPPLTYYATNGSELISKADNYFNLLSPGTYIVYVVDSTNTSSIQTTVNVAENQILTITMINNCALTPTITEP